jgi:hypothetical protein
MVEKRRKICESERLEGSQGVSFRGNGEVNGNDIHQRCMVAIHDKKGVFG